MLSRFHTELKAQIDVDKWVESEKAGQDLGEDYVREWLGKNGRAYKRKYIDKLLIECMEEVSSISTNKIRLRENLEEVFELLKII